LLTLHLLGMMTLALHLVGFLILALHLFMVMSLSLAALALNLVLDGR
jgi:hypothetical protein